MVNELLTVRKIRGTIWTFDHSRIFHTDSVVSTNYYDRIATYVRWGSYAFEEISNIRYASSLPANKTNDPFSQFKAYDVRNNITSAKTSSLTDGLNLNFQMEEDDAIYRKKLE